MSTSWNAECMDHPDANWMLAEDWQGSGDGPATQIAKLWSNREGVAAVLEVIRKGTDIDIEVETAGYRRLSRGEMEWLATHKNCRIELVSEYRDRKSVDLVDVAPHHCATCTCPPR